MSWLEFLESSGGQTTSNEQVCQMMTPSPKESRKNLLAGYSRLRAPTIPDEESGL